VLSKPVGLPTTSPDPEAQCLVREAERLDPKAPRLHASSRLDSVVSGLVTFARTAEATKALLEARKAGTYGRRYLGITLAEAKGEGEWTSPISLHPRDRRLRTAGPGKGERGARTRFSVASTAAGALLALHPETGRTHQLRVHAAAAGWPLFGDSSYGGERRWTRSDGRVVSMRRCALHCGRLRITSSLGLLDLTLPPPDDFVRAWRGLGGDDDAIEAALSAPL